MTTSRTNKIVWISSALLILAACSKEEPAAVEETAPLADEQIIDAGEEAAAGELAETTEDTLEVVEESAAEPEDTGETPIVMAQADTAAEHSDLAGEQTQETLVS